CRDLIEFLFAGHRLRIMPNLPRSLNPPILPFTIAKTSCLGSKCALQTHSGERFSKSRNTSAGWRVCTLSARRGYAIAHLLTLIGFKEALHEKNPRMVMQYHLDRSARFKCERTRDAEEKVRSQTG